MSKKSIPISDLEIKADTEGEQDRSRKVFENIRDRVNKREDVTEHEKNFFCSCLEFSLLNDGKPKDFSCCKNYIFVGTYLAYFNDIVGNEIHYKPDRAAAKIAVAKKEVDINNLDSKRFMRPVPPDEMWRDLSYLYKEADEWNVTIQATNHRSEALQIASKETRSQLVLLEASIPSNEKNTRRAKLKKQHTLLNQKFIHQVALEVRETMSADSYEMQLNGNIIEYNLYSLYHIVSRHYAAGSKQFNTGKSFINPDFAPRQLHLDLSRIINDIDVSGLYSKDSIEKITFTFKNVAYQLWIKRDVTKQVRGIGNVLFNRVDSFYPLEDPSDILDVNANYNLVKINDELSVYLKK